MEELIKNKLLALRREIHKFPDLSGFESATAQRIVKFLEPYHPDKIIDGLGGYGLAAVFQGKRAGATVIYVNTPLPSQSSERALHRHSFRLPQNLYFSWKAAISLILGASPVLSLIFRCTIAATPVERPKRLIKPVASL